MGAKQLELAASGIADSGKTDRESRRWSAAAAAAPALPSDFSAAIELIVGVNHRLALVSLHEELHPPRPRGVWRTGFPEL
jgi:hypothetical protein